MQEIAIKFEHVKKEYRLGQIGGGTLRGDLQSMMARLRGKEDPNSLVGSNPAEVGKRFLALDDISFEIKKGEAVGIIGHNGAGKSTLLKLLSRVTGPSAGKISYRGRIASMLEVGTGFHPEMTGRENIYLNGAILGMTKAEIDKKLEDIIEFSEVRQFIDTPVKRYSSGMYVKLAFSVAAHLDAEIMIMDEVLAVGDMAFQKKCLSKMREAAKQEGRTVLYVSHNMNTIRQLCDRCIVLEKGRLVFDGDVEKGIDRYMGAGSSKTEHANRLRLPREKHEYCSDECTISEIRINREENVFFYGECIRFHIKIQKNQPVTGKYYLRIIIRALNGDVVTMASTEKPIRLEKDDNRYIIGFPLGSLVPGKYTATFVLYEIGERGINRNVDVLRDIYSFAIKATAEFNHGMEWVPLYWGYHANDYLEYEEVAFE